ncbi:glycoside hydrolase family 2 protein [Treponema putidum]|uniref:Glycoside hydrolase family 2 n=1 Tax=Treponema putidum TaxID=221027 RepID=A0AAE9SIV2_9SPIR|nr:sugar-binding domain-containing protein [Treponema putidum]UTY28480.1 glycoside hydrolase family 2 [Treponema putidum]UTY30931.1 glycoside hydrolase family 2 [Treponema putidum]UTY33346.1 glycoside hydrolase family 2 [Treponema putidum]
MRKNKPIKQLLTPWGESLNKDCPLNEYPRPQLVRENWQCLNGRWDYAITETEGHPIKWEPPKTWDGAIIVPFSPESLLSGVQRQLLPGKKLWYRREFAFEKCKDGERLLLHFGAVDQHCSVYINGKKAGSHSGGYWPFYFDITDFINSDKTEITVLVIDNTDTGDEAYGKQTLNRGEIWYTGQSGIWQTVWSERVPENYIQTVKITPHFKKAEVELELFMCCGAGLPPQIGNISVKIFDGEKAVSEGNIQDNHIFLKMPDDFKSWSPESPFLYDLEIKAGKDTVYSYFGMREFGLLDGKSGPVLSLNGKPIFHHGLLDQGYWSDGMYTPSSDEAMIWEIKTLKNMGFNMLRKHIKIEPLRWYYHCDKLGMLVWQDFVSGGGPYKDFVVKYAPWLGFNFKDGKSRYALHGRKSESGRKNFMRDAERTIDLLYSITSIAVWVPFNEGWGQFDAASAAALIRKKDTTRLIDHASGYFDQGEGDFHSYHIYYKAFRPKKDKRGRVLALTEFGGFSLPVQGHMSSDILFGYKMFGSKEELNEAIWNLYKKDVLPAIEKGLSASIYTQVSDVEDEINGIFTYDRKEIKFNEDLGLKIAKKLNEIFKDKFNGNL